MDPFTQRELPMEQWGWKEFLTCAQGHLSMGNFAQALMHYSVAYGAMKSTDDDVSSKFTVSDLANRLHLDPAAVMEFFGGTSMQTPVSMGNIKILTLSMMNTASTRVRQGGGAIPMGPSETNEDGISDDMCYTATHLFPTDLTRQKRFETFDSLQGMEKEKELMRQTFIYPAHFPNLYPKSSKGFLLYGPPGTGKTNLIRATINEINKRASIRYLFYAPKAASLKGKYVGETEKKIEQVFRCAKLHAQDCCDPKAPHVSIIFIDEIDNIARDRSNDMSGTAASSVNALLQLMDGVEKLDNVVVIGATNYPWDLDRAVLRRFDRQILIGLPDSTTISKLIEWNVKNQIKTLEPMYGEWKRRDTALFKGTVQTLDDTPTTPTTPTTPLSPSSSVTSMSPPMTPTLRDDRCARKHEKRHTRLRREEYCNVPMPDEPADTYTEITTLFGVQPLTSPGAMQKLAKQAEDRHFSMSEVQQMCNTAIVDSGNAARQRGLFWRYAETFPLAISAVSLVDMGKIHGGQWVYTETQPIQKIRGADGKIYVSAERVDVHYRSPLIRLGGARIQTVFFRDDPDTQKTIFSPKTVKDPVNGPVDLIVQLEPTTFHPQFTHLSALAEWANSTEESAPLTGPTFRALVNSGVTIPIPTEWWFEVEAVIAEAPYYPLFVQLWRLYVELGMYTWGKSQLLLFEWILQNLLTQCVTDVKRADDLKLVVALSKIEETYPTMDIRKVEQAELEPQVPMRFTISPFIHPVSRRKLNPDMKTQLEKVAKMHDERIKTMKLVEDSSYRTALQMLQEAELESYDVDKGFQLQLLNPQKANATFFISASITIPPKGFQKTTTNTNSGLLSSLIDGGVEIVPDLLDTMCQAKNAKLGILNRDGKSITWSDLPTLSPTPLLVSWLDLAWGIAAGAAGVYYGGSQVVMAVAGAAAFAVSFLFKWFTNQHPISIKWGEGNWTTSVRNVLGQIGKVVAMNAPSALSAIGVAAAGLSPLGIGIPIACTALSAALIWYQGKGDIGDLHRHLLSNTLRSPIVEVMGAAESTTPHVLLTRAMARHYAEVDWGNSMAVKTGSGKVVKWEQWGATTFTNTQSMPDDGRAATRVHSTDYEALYNTALTDENLLLALTKVTPVYDAKNTERLNLYALNPDKVFQELARERSGK